MDVVKIELFDDEIEKLDKIMKYLNNDTDVKHGLLPPYKRKDVIVSCISKGMKVILKEYEE